MRVLLLLVSCVRVRVQVLKCKELGRAMRIGTNHGSLSARTLSYYGDTPAGMVESAFEFARICRKHDYHNFLFSMKVLISVGEAGTGIVMMPVPAPVLMTVSLTLVGTTSHTLHMRQASNPKVMVAAYRLLAAEMYDLGWEYPMHLGVTEAGEGEDGRMKSAIGIGSLLQVLLFPPPSPSPCRCRCRTVRIKNIGS